MTIATFLLTRRLGLVSDDFFLLVDNLRLPLTKSVDELHRPLRNILLHWLGATVGVRHVWPYRLLVAASYAAVLGLFFQLSRKLGSSWIGAWTAVLFLAFFPRNQEVLFWFAAWQDIAVSVFVLLTCIFFLEYRNTNRGLFLTAASLAYALALGFKETVVILPALLLLLDIYQQRSSQLLKHTSFWRPYVPFVALALLYVGYYMADSGMASLIGQRTGGTYGFHGLASVIAGLARAFLNIALPFVLPVPLGLAAIRPHHVAILALEMLLVLFIVQRTRTWWAFSLGAGWLVVTILPTATFVGAGNADRYLFVPVLGLALSVGLIVTVFVGAERSLNRRLIVWAGVAAFCVAGLFYLGLYRNLWAKAGEEASAVAMATIQASSQLQPGGEIDLVNQTGTWLPHIVFVFSNGLGGALRGNGLRPDVRVLANLAEPKPDQQRFVEKLQACAAASNSGARIVLFMFDHRLTNLDPGCAGALVEADRQSRPKAWRLVNPE